MDQKIAAEFSAWPNFISTAPGVAYAYLADYRRNRKDVFFEAETLAELAAKLGMPAGTLEKTVAEYNGNLPTGLPPIDRAPYCALGPAKSWIVFTDGGARINSNFQVVDRGGQPIAGSTQLALPGRAGCCSKATGIISAGLSYRAAWRAAAQRLATPNGPKPRSLRGAPPAA